MLELEDAQARILAAIPEPRSESIPLVQAHGRIAAERIFAPINLPVFDNSSMDGYAVRSEDVVSAKPELPVRLRLAGRAAAGEVFQGLLGPGECVRVFTGSPMPHGADAVVMQEDTRIDGVQPGDVLVLDSARPWENVRFRGEDVKDGSIVANAGEHLTATRLALLAALGVANVNVSRRPVVGLLPTGSELREAGQPIAPGQIYESNRAGLSALLTGMNCIPRILPIVADARNQTVAALKSAFAETDCVVTCGGVSVGEMDFVKSSFEELSGELQFWKVAIKPGRPFVFGRIKNRFLFGLPGNPASAFVTFLLLVRPALLHWQGAKNVGLASSPGILAETLSNSGERRHFMRVTMDLSGRVRPAGMQASHALSSLAAANGLIDVPPKTALPAEMKVNVLRWE